MHISIVMPTYNRAYCIGRAIQSMMAQTFRDWDLIIVDDGSTDETEAVVDAVKHTVGARLTYVRQTNGGASRARNNGIARASGDWIGFLDSDDYFYPEKLFIQSKMLGRIDDVAMCFTGWSTFYSADERGVPFHPMPASFAGCIYPWLLTVARNCVVTPSVLVRRQELLASGLFDPEMRICEDIDLWRRICRQNKALKVDTPLVGVHTRKGETFGYSAGLRGRMHLYEKAAREDVQLPREFFEFVYQELLDVYVLHARNAGDRQEKETLKQARNAIAAATGRHSLESLSDIYRDAINALDGQRGR